jgi:uncharacterized membrane protein
VALVLLIGVVVRHWFNLHEGGVTGGRILWQWPVTAALVAGLVLLTAWRPDRVAVPAVGDAEAMAIVAAHCTACHAARPAHEGFDAPPGGVALESAEAVRRFAPKVLAQAVDSEAMPLGNETGMTADERAALGAWLRAGE